MGKNASTNLLYQDYLYNKEIQDSHPFFLNALRSGGKHTNGTQTKSQNSLNLTFSENLSI